MSSDQKLDLILARIDTIEDAVNDLRMEFRNEIRNEVDSLARSVAEEFSAVHRELAQCVKKSDLLSLRFKIVTA